MKCSCCHIESSNLREYVCSRETVEYRKTIESYYLCVLCRMLFSIKPEQVAARCRGEHNPTRITSIPRFVARRAA